LLQQNSGKFKMKTTTQYSTASIQLNSLADLDQIVSQQFNLPPRPYSTDMRAALELVVQALENSDAYFEISRSESNAFPGLPFVVSFDKEKRTYGKTAPLAICHDALHRLKRVVITIPGSYYWNVD
jgi:Phage ABA sandwich domain